MSRKREENRNAWKKRHSKRGQGRQPQSRETSPRKYSHPTPPAMLDIPKRILVPTRRQDSGLERSASSYTELIL